MFVLISVPSVSLFASTVHLFTAKRLHNATNDVVKRPVVFHIAFPRGVLRMSGK